MRKCFLLLVLAFVTLSVFQSCSSDLEVPFENDPSMTVTPSGAGNEDYFPMDDGASALSNDPAEALRQLVVNIKPERALSKGDLIITDEQFAEIKAFVDENLRRDNETDTYKAIFGWLVSNLQYAHGSTVAYLDPYDVFKRRTCVCQGYANLLKTMLLTQNIPAFGANGWLGNIGAHAWNYTYVDDEWIVSDATNNQWFFMKDVSKYRNLLIPFSTEISLFEDDRFTYDFQERQLNVSEVKCADEAYLTIPFSVGGYKITSFCPAKPVPENFKQLYLGKNILTFGASLNLFSECTNSIEEVFIDSANPELSTYKGVVYGRYQQAPYYIPAGMKRVELRLLEKVEKNTIYNLPYVEEIVFAEGTKYLEAYAIENCPRLKRVYVPETVTVIEENAIYRCPSDVEIIRGITGIHNVQM